MSHKPQPHAARKAEFAERAMAFAIDYALFAGIWYLVLKAVDPTLPVLLNEKGTLVTGFLAALFLIYHAFFSCEGRATLGKSLLGIRVAGADGEPLDIGRAVIRAISYIPSSLFTLGFFWALIDPKGHAWHDLAAGSGVVSDHRLGRVRGPILRLAAGTLVVAFALSVGWSGIWEARYLKIMTVAHAKVGLNEVKTLQASYHQRNGRYAGSLFALAEVSPDPRGFLRDMAILYHLDNFRFKADQSRWAVATRARDVDSTLIAAHGP
ncbi:MAG: RDD family protein [Elusimicrobiota bacterium]|jgi:uncharacterized RDD family membrane protein YckC